MSAISSLFSPPPQTVVAKPMPTVDPEAIKRSQQMMQQQQVGAQGGTVTSQSDKLG